MGGCDEKRIYHFEVYLIFFRWLFVLCMLAIKIFFLNMEVENLKPTWI